MSFQPVNFTGKQPYSPCVWAPWGGSAEDFENVHNLKKRCVGLFCFDVPSWQLFGLLCGDYILILALLFRCLMPQACPLRKQVTEVLIPQERQHIRRYVWVEAFYLTPGRDNNSVPLIFSIFCPISCYPKPLHNSYHTTWTSDFAKGEVNCLPSVCVCANENVLNGQIQYWILFISRSWRNWVFLLHSNKAHRPFFPRYREPGLLKSFCLSSSAWLCMKSRPDPTQPGNTAGRMFFFLCVCVF